MALRKIRVQTAVFRRGTAVFLAALLFLIPTANTYGADDVEGMLHAQTSAHIHIMEQNLHEHPEDKELSNRLRKAKKLFQNADNYLAMEDMVKNQESHMSPTAGFSSTLHDVASDSDFWKCCYNKCCQKCLKLDAESDYYYGYLNLSEVRKKLVNTAMSCEGKIPYVWGGKPSSPDLSPQWESGESGLDCSGFVEWVYWNALGTDVRGLYSTYSIARSQQKIRYDELLPGDLGMITDEGTYYTDIAGNKFYAKEEAVSSSHNLRNQAIAQQKKEKQNDSKKSNKKIKNKSAEQTTEIDVPYLTSNQLSLPDSTTHASHVGIYVGKDANGNALWCHCTGGSIKTVTVNNYSKFHYYYRVL